MGLSDRDERLPLPGRPASNQRKGVSAKVLDKISLCCREFEKVEDCTVEITQHVQDTRCITDTGRSEQ